MSSDSELEILRQNNVDQVAKLLVFQKNWENALVEMKKMETDIAKMAEEKTKMVEEKIKLQQRMHIVEECNLDLLEDTAKAMTELGEEKKLVAKLQQELEDVTDPVYGVAGMTEAINQARLEEQEAKEVAEKRCAAAEARLAEAKKLGESMTDEVGNKLTKGEFEKAVDKAAWKLFVSLHALYPNGVENLTPELEEELLLSVHGPRPVWKGVDGGTQTEAEPTKPAWKGVDGGVQTDPEPSKPAWKGVDGGVQTEPSKPRSWAVDGSTQTEISVPAKDPADLALWHSSRPGKVARPTYVSKGVQTDKPAPPTKVFDINHFLWVLAPLYFGPVLCLWFAARGNISSVYWNSFDQAGHGAYGFGGSNKDTLWGNLQARIAIELVDLFNLHGIFQKFY